MTIQITDTVCSVDSYSQLAFIEILNTIVLSEHIVELNRRLISRDRESMAPRLAGYYKWKFADNTFTLWQRTGYNSSICFTKKLLEVEFRSFVSPDRERIYDPKN